MAAGSFVSVWIAGLPGNTDRANTRVWLGETTLRVEYVGEPDDAGLRQFNAAVPEGARRRSWGRVRGSETGLIGQGFSGHITDGRDKV